MDDIGSVTISSTGFCLGKGLPKDRHTGHCFCCANFIAPKDASGIIGNLVSSLTRKEVTVTVVARVDVGCGT